MKTVALHCGDIELPIIDIDKIPDIPENGAALFILASTRTISLSEKKLYSCLSIQEAARAMAYRRPDQRSAYILNHALLRLVLSKHLKLQPKDIPLRQGPFGKPCLAEEIPPYFNISDSNHMVLLAFSLNAELGVDIEKISEDTDYSAIAGKFFSMAECKNIRENGIEHFFKFWTRKESALKACGLGITQHLHRVSVLDGQNNLIIEPGYPGEAFRQDHEVYSMLYNKYFIAFSSPKPFHPKSIYYLHDLNSGEDKS